MGRQRGSRPQWSYFGAAAAVAVAAAALAGQPDDPPLARTYGSGVHAYYSGDFDRCYEELSAAIEAGSRDPRALYYRGLSALRLGRLDEAEADFSAGADLESRDIGGWPVSRSLERVQGPDRLRLERHRTRARVAALERDRTAARRRYSQIEDAQPEVLRRRRPAARPAPDGAAGNPFAEQPDAEPGAEPAPPGPEPEPEPEAMPVPEEPAAPAEEPSEEPTAEQPSEEPMAEPAEPAEPALEPEMELPEPVPGDAAAPDADDPFGDGAAPAAEAEPAP